MIAQRSPVTDIRTWFTVGVSQVIPGAYEVGFGQALSHPNLYKIDGNRYWNGEVGIETGSM